MNTNSIKFQGEEMGTAHELHHEGTPLNPCLDFIVNEKGRPAVAFAGFDAKEQCDAFDITELDRVIEMIKEARAILDNETQKLTTPELNFTISENC